MARRGYPPEFRRRVVDLVEGGRKVSEVAADLEVGEQTLAPPTGSSRVVAEWDPSDTCARTGRAGGIPIPPLLGEHAGGIRREGFGGRGLAGERSPGGVDGRLDRKADGSDDQGEKGGQGELAVGPLLAFDRLMMRDRNGVLHGSILRVRAFAIVAAPSTVTKVAAFVHSCLLTAQPAQREISETLFFLSVAILWAIRDRPTGNRQAPPHGSSRLQPRASGPGAKVVMSEVATA